jgi:hypothetical protein
MGNWHMFQRRSRAIVKKIAPIALAIPVLIASYWVVDEWGKPEPLLTFIAALLAWLGTLSPFLLDQEKNTFASRQAKLAQQMKSQWIDRVLENSRPARLIPLKMVMQKVVQPRSQQEQLTAQSPLPQPLPADSDVRHCFAWHGGEGLLIAGVEGVGKTLLLLRMAEAWLAETAPTLVTPLILPLHSWRGGSLLTWISQETRRLYGIEEDAIEEGVRENKIILLLDGLGEGQTVDEQQRCIQAIAAFCQEQPVAVVVTTRSHTGIATAAALARDLHLSTALYIYQPDQATIEAYLAQGDQTEQNVWRYLQSVRLQPGEQWAPLPLELRLMILAEVGEAPSADTLAGYRARLVELYVQRMYGDRRVRTYHVYNQSAPALEEGWTADQSRPWLQWLAQTMIQHRLNPFQMEQMQPTLLPSVAQHLFYFLGSRLLVGLLVGLWLALCGWAFSQVVSPSFPAVLIGFSGLALGLISGLIAGLAALISQRTTAFSSPLWPLVWRLGIAFTMWQVVGIVLLVVTLLILHLEGNLTALFRADTAADTRQALAVFTLTGPMIGIFWGVISWLITGIVFDPRRRQHTYSGDIQVTEQLTWSFRQALWPTTKGSLAGCGCGLLISLFMVSTITMLTFTIAPIWNEPLPIAQSLTWFKAIPVTTLALAAIFSLAQGLTGGLVETPPDWADSSRQPNQGVELSRQNALHVSLVFGLGGFLIGLVVFLMALFLRGSADFQWLTVLLHSLLWAVAFGLLGGLAYGGSAVIQHQILTFLLRRQGAIPPDLPHFLRDAANRRILRQIGGGYTFFYAVLHDHFHSKPAP